MGVHKTFCSSLLLYRPIDLQILLIVFFSVVFLLHSPKYTLLLEAILYSFSCIYSFSISFSYMLMRFVTDSLTTIKIP